jgi:lactoylglutathione lyase
MRKTATTDAEGAAENRMNIAHIALWCADLERAKDFYTTYFGGRAGAKYTNSKRQFESYFVDFDGGARLELMRQPDHFAAPGPARRGYAHLAFSVGSPEAVDALTRHLQAAGYPCLDGPRRTGDGYYESLILDPEGNRVEITV